MDTATPTLSLRPLQRRCFDPLHAWCQDAQGESHGWDPAAILGVRT